MSKISRRTQFHAERSSYGRSVRLYGVTYEDGEGVTELQPVSMRRFTCLEWEERTATPQDPFMELRTESAQQLFDALWAAGFRPVDTTENAGQIKAMGAHLQDMRALVRHLTKAEL